MAMSAQAANAERNTERAALSFWAMQHSFFDSRAGVYREEAGARVAARAWPFSQVIAATMSMANSRTVGHLYVHAAALRLSGLGRYRLPDGSFASVAGPSGPVYYDDNEWIALDLVRWYDLRSVGHALAAANRLFKFVVGGWDSDAAHACPGGVFWTTTPATRDRNTVTTATGALLALELYQRTHDPGLLTWARAMLGWVSACMLAPDGLLWDHLRLDGSRDQTHWSYNQGTVIGANVLLYQLTGDRSALHRAEQLADLSLSYFETVPGGREPPPFLAIFFGNLLALQSVDGNTRYREVVQAYADAAWDRVRDPSTGLFPFNRARRAQLIDQAAMVQIYAALGVPPSTRAVP